MTNTFNMFAITILISAVVMLVRAEETHLISFNNACHEGTPQLVIGGKVVPEGILKGPQSGIAFLKDGPGNDCGPNGENCVIVQFTLSNAGSGAAISLIPPHVFDIGIEYSFITGCSGGVLCMSPDCDALHTANDQAGTSCSAPYASLLITFCPDLVSI